MSAWLIDMSEKPSSDSSRPSIGILGCGSLGTAILKGLLASRSKTGSENSFQPGKLLASVTSESSLKTLKSALGEQSEDVKIFRGDNASLAKQSDVIILAVPPDVMGKVLDEKDVTDALHGKVLISVLAGVTRDQMNTAIHWKNTELGERRCWVFRTMLNLAASLGASATAIEASPSDYPEDKVKLVDDIFNSIGNIVHMPESTMNACTPLCGSTPAFIALFLDALVDGAIAGGVPRAKAEAVAIQALASTAALLQAGQSPSQLRETVCAMPGCTIQGILDLEQGGVRGVTAKTMKNTIVAASKLGQD